MDLNRRDPCFRVVDLLDNKLNSSDRVFLDNSDHQDHPVEDLDSWDRDHHPVVDQAAVHQDLEDQEWVLEVPEWVPVALVWDLEVLEWGPVALEWVLNDLDQADLVARGEMDHEDLQVAVPILE